MGIRRQDSQEAHHLALAVGLSPCCNTRAAITDLGPLRLIRPGAGRAENGRIDEKGKPAVIRRNARE